MPNSVDTDGTGKKKKKSRRRSSAEVADNEASDGEGVKKSSSARKTKSTKKKKTFGDEAELKNSLTLTTKKKATKINNVKWDNDDSSDDEVQAEETEHKRQRFAAKKRDVSFSGSTIQRIRDRGMGQGTGQSGPTNTESVLDAALGSASSSETKTSFSLDAVMGKLPQSSADNGSSSALRPSKYGGGRGISFAEEPENDDKPKFKVSPTFQINGSTHDNSPDKIAPKASSEQPRRKTFRTADTNSEDTVSFAPPIPGKPTRSSMSDSENDARFSSARSESNLKSSLTRPGIQRRNSMNSMPSSLTAADDIKAENISNVKHNSLVGSVVSSMTSNEKQLRRTKMSMANQIYVPPKSRRKSIFQAVAHIMAGRTVELVMWTYGASFGKVMLFFLTFYVFNIFMWAGVMDLVDQATNGGYCIHGSDAAGMSRIERYELAFELSWSTFTTVGYGAVSPPGDISGCYAIRLVCAFVAFTGVLFGSTTAAIMYSKLMRLLAHAHVQFSSTLCVQYGKGTEGGTVRYGQLNFRASVSVDVFHRLTAEDLLNDDEDEKKNEESPAGSDDGYPVIEFRMINDRANHEGSEIWDCQIRGIVQLHKEKPSTDSDAAANAALKDKAAGGGSTLDLEKKVYYPITLTPDSHPHFSRIWYARHVLNSESPLLKREIRDMIATEKKWDPDFNTWKEIRDCLNPFISLRITLSGTSAVSASTVFAEHVYEFDDVYVGWRFANMVYEKNDVANWWNRLIGGDPEEEEEEENPDMKTKIDAALLHDIVPQPGGDHEPLDEDDIDSGFHFGHKRPWGTYT